MDKHLGLGVMINMLRGYDNSFDILKEMLGKKISQITLKDNEILLITFENGEKIAIKDDGQSCCERRYMRTDDNLETFKGAVFTDLAIKDGPNIDDADGSHQIQFLEVYTNRGPMSFSNHNEHNGWYGGFWITVSKCE